MLMLKKKKSVMDQKEERPEFIDTHAGSLLTGTNYPTVFVNSTSLSQEIMPNEDQSCRYCHCLFWKFPNPISPNIRLSNFSVDNI